MYADVGPISEEVIASLRWFLEDAKWSPADNGEYMIWHPDQEKLGNILGRDLPKEYSSFFLNIPAGGFVHIHRDNEKPYETYHIPVYTNEHCLCYSQVDQGTIHQHLPVGRQFRVKRTELHWSTNFGDTERIHLLLAL